MVQNRKRGFTLIELIIGITILALLAVGLLAALDPAEQFNKARDTSTRNTLLEIYGAFQRYEAAQESYPADFANMSVSTGAVANAIEPVNMKQAIADLIASGELKPNFESAAGTALSKIYVYKDNTRKIMTCFKPSAKSFKLAAGLFTNASNAVDLGKDAPSSVNAEVTCAGQKETTNCSLNATDPTLRECCVYCAQ